MRRRTRLLGQLRGGEQNGLLIVVDDEFGNFFLLRGERIVVFFDALLHCFVFHSRPHKKINFFIYYSTIFLRLKYFFLFCRHVAKWK